MNGHTEGKAKPQAWFLAGSPRGMDIGFSDIDKPKKLSDFLAQLKAAGPKATLGLDALLDCIDSELADWRKQGKTADLDEHTREDRLAWRPLLQFSTAVKAELGRKP